MNKYAENIQNTLEKTKVVVIPTPNDAQAIDISSMLESLYFEGYKSIVPVDFESKLIGTVFVGNIPLPLASDGTNYSKTVLPYVDFDNKGYIYNHETKNYERNSLVSEPKAEIWHGFISPNTGNLDDDADAINDYFQKNDSYYQWVGNFDAGKGIMNGDRTEDVPSGYQPFVFFYDQYRENVAVDSVKYKWYQAYYDNLEDITYYRFSKELAEKVKQYILGEQDAELSDLIAKLDPGFDTSALGWPSTEWQSDIATRYITKNSTKRFIEIFNEATIADFRKYVNNAGRYSGTSGQVDVDLAPFLVSVLDLVSTQVIKNANTELENKIDEIINSGLSRNIALPTKITIDPTCPTTYQNVLYGQKANTITGALDCSFYRGSLDNGGTLVASSRGYNINLLQTDINKCQSVIRSSNLAQYTRGIWWGHSPMSLNQDKIQNGPEFELTGNLDPDLALVKLYDPAGSQYVADVSKTPSPLFCLDNNYLLTEQNHWEYNVDPDTGSSTDICVHDYTHPDFNATSSAMCRQVSQKYNFPQDFSAVYKSCGFWKTVKLDGVNVGSCNGASEVYEYKKIPSTVSHRSPDSAQLKSQVKWVITPALPIDKDRYVDFIGADGSYQKLNYPYLFRIQTVSENPSMDEFENLLKQTLDGVSANMNQIATATNPATLSGKDKEIYEALKSWVFPSENTDLYNYIASKPTKVYTLSGDQKTVSYLDTLTFALYWNSLTSASAKYAFIIENYLSDQFGGNEFLFVLPKNKKVYEVAQLWAPGDGNSMYIKMDPEGKWANPYQDVVAANTLLNGYLFSSNVAGPQDDNEWTFKCAPPDGVPIWQWIPAIVCRLKDMLPPKIKISDGVCGQSLLTKEQQDELEACSWDANKNGINDCIEGKLTWGELRLQSDASRYYYESPATIRAWLYDKDGVLLTFDNNTEIFYRLVKIEAPRDKTLLFDSSNVEVVYDYTTETQETRELVSQYASFFATWVRAASGEADMLMSVRSKDANLYFEAFVDIKDANGNTAISLLSNEVKIEVRGDRLFSSAYRMYHDEEEVAQLDIGESTIQVSEYPNIYLVDESQNDVNQMYTLIDEDSQATEKLVFSVSNFSKAGNILPLDYPLQVQLIDGEQTIEDITLYQSDLISFKRLFSLIHSGEYTLHITDNLGNVFERQFQLLPDVATTGDIILGSNIIEKGGAVSTSVITLYDRFGNVANGEMYTLSWDISGNSLRFYENDNTSYEIPTLEGYKAFRMVSTNREGNATITFDIQNAWWENMFEVTKQVQVVPSINFSISALHTNVYVWGEEYKYKVIVKDASGNTFSNLNSRMYLSLDSSLGTPTQSYFDVENGEATVSFTTKKLAKKTTDLTLQLEGAKTIAKKAISILPLDPIRTDVSASKTKMEATSDESSIVKVELKDRYGNTVFTDSTSMVSLEIPDKYKAVLKADAVTGTVREWVASFTLRATPIPGIAYFKTTVSPGLENNSFTLPWQNPFPKPLLTITALRQDGVLTDLWKKLFEEVTSSLYRFRPQTESALLSNEAYNALWIWAKATILQLFRDSEGIVVRWVSQNAGSIETFYFWNSEKVEGNKYNAVYTTLLWSNYGDITQKGYLAWGLLFDLDNRALAVTSLLNNPSKYLDTVSIHENGLVETNPGWWDITQTLEYSVNYDVDGRIKLWINNVSLSSYIGDVYYTFDAGNTFINTCDDLWVDFDWCYPADDESSILLRSNDSNYTVKYTGNKISLVSAYSGEVFSITQDGFVNKNANIYLEYESFDTLSPLFKIMTWDRQIWVLGFHMFEPKVVKTRDATVLSTSLQNVENAIILHVVSGLYGYRDIFDGKQTTHYIYYQDPFSSDTTTDIFTQSNLNGFENFKDDGGLGWQWANKTFLLYSSGKSVGESTRDNQSFSLINLWDPVVSLKKIQKNIPWKASLRSFEQGIWDQVLDVDGIVNYKVFDYNNDGRDDMVALNNRGYFTLLENKQAHEPFKNLGNLAYIDDMKWRTLMEAWDFTGDGYDDIFFVDKNGDPFLLNNVEKDFVRYSLKNNFNLDGKIIQVRAFDMDNDGEDDLVTLDDAGQIHIFYGGGSPKNPQFTKLLVGNGYGIELSQAVRNEWWLVYFDGLYQLPDLWNNADLLASNEEFLRNIQQNMDNVDEEYEFLYNAWFVDNIIFERIPYDFDSNDDGSIDFPDTGDDELDIYVDEAEQDIEDFLFEFEGYVDVDDFYSTEHYTTFIKSEFSKSQGIEVKKRYTDINGGTLKTGDGVKVDVTLTNVTGANLRDVIYLESVTQPFVLNQEVPLSIPNGVRVSPGTSGYEFMLDNFNLGPWASMTFSYQLTTLPIRFGHILVWLFEEGEVGDDLYGDIIVKPNNKNCGQETDIYRSIATRSYEKWSTPQVCVWDAADDKTKDENDNGIPDYIEDLIGWSDEDILDYAKDELDNLFKDSDGDGIPDAEDDTPYYDDEDGLLNFQDDISQVVDELSGQLDFLIKWFSCGFGWGSCIASPLNWAPLAPGNDPTFMWIPIGDGLHINEWWPVFAFPTIPACPTCPPFWPPSPTGAGWWLTPPGISNFRLFVTPTLTWAAGTAICFWPNTLWYANPPWVHPIVPGWNCVVAAMPLLWCQDDGSDGHIGELLPPGIWDFGIINGNCSDDSDYQSLRDDDGNLFDDTLVREYIQFKKTWIATPSFKDRLKQALSTVASGRRYSWWAVFPREAFINLQGWGADDMTLSVDIDAGALVNWNFQDVVKVQMKRVWPFPDFLMEWVTRQIEEVVTKLTDLPTLVIILPDMSGLMDGRWSNFWPNLEKKLQENSKKYNDKESNRQAKIASLETAKSRIDCSKNQALCLNYDAQISKLQSPTYVPGGVRQSLSGMSAVYQFLSNMPLVAVEPQVVSINIPWIDGPSLKKWIFKWQMTLEQWKQEINRATAAWSLWATCNQSDPDEKQACQESNAVKQKVIVDARKLVSSLEKNIQILKEYQDFPRKLSELIGKKEERLAQILCNIESITALLWGWIGKNGKRFQAWVELIILIKAILKSWQVLIDIFTWFDQSCHKCKNERHDLMYFIFKLINMVIPKIPIIQFPKWPDIILDLHNIRAGLIIFLPDFKFTLRPIQLPNLPELRLPDTPNVNIKLPALPVLPRIVLPKLPDLPSLPKVTLPDLPPPPKIPKLFASLEAIADIAKLVTKVMCILKSSPFVPEWRAWDQIAFITERTGYLSFDFLDLALPQFSYPFVDAIKVTTYVNLEFENEFVVEMVRNILQPLNNFSANITNSMGWSVGTLDFSDAVPANINVDPTKEDPIQTGYKTQDIYTELIANRENTSNIVDDFVQNLTKITLQEIVKLSAYLEAEKENEVSSTEFIQTVHQNLASKTITSDPAFAPLLAIWDDVLTRDTTQEEKLISKLLENNTKKYQTLHDILTTEIAQTQQLRQEIDSLMSESGSTVTQISATDTTRIDEYNKRLDEFNEKTFSALQQAIEPDFTLEDELSARWENILSRVRGGLDVFAQAASKSNIWWKMSVGEPLNALSQEVSPSLISSVVDSSLAIASPPGSAAWKLLAATGSGSTSGICTNDGQKYNYKWLYVVEEGVSYRLFHYLDEITGDEETISFDYDLDGDDDLVYMMWGTIYTKENLKIQDGEKVYVDDAPLYIAPRNNKFYNGDVYYESVNGLREGDVNDSFINVLFSAPKRDNMRNFRLEFYEIVDKYYNLLWRNYEPENLKKYIIDGIAGFRDVSPIQDNDQYRVSPNLAYMENPGSLAWVTMITRAYTNLLDDLRNGTQVTLTAGVPLYAGGSRFKLGYKLNQDSEITYVTVEKWNNIAFHQAVIVESLTSDAYLESERKIVLEWQAIQEYAYLPLSFETEIYIDQGLDYNASSHIEIRYYDGTLLPLDFRYIKRYLLYDLGSISTETYLIRQELKNDFYYANIKTFKEDIVWTFTQQILLSPQKEADGKAPEITVDGPIRIPVYQQQNFDFTEYIYEELGIKNIVDFYIDFDLDTDSDGDNDKINDRTATGIVIHKTPSKISVDFWPYDTIFTKNIAVHAIDGNNNHWVAIVPFQVYAPIPTIRDNENVKIVGHIDENLKNEPVNIYRYRWGILSKLLEQDGTQKVYTGTWWGYAFNSQTASWLVLKYNEIDGAYIDEYTGVIRLVNPAMTIRVTPSNEPWNDKIFPIISILWNSAEIYYQYLTFSRDKQVEIVANFDSVDEPGMYFSFTGEEGWYNYYHIPLNAPLNPGATIIYDISRGRDTALFTIFRDGRIDTAWATYRLDYAVYGWDTVMYRLIDENTDREIGKLLMKVDGNYIMK